MRVLIAGAMDYVGYFLFNKILKIGKVLRTSIINKRRLSLRLQSKKFDYGILKDTEVD